MALRIWWISLVVMLIVSGCTTPSFIDGKRVKREYFPKGQLKSEFIMSDFSGKSGILKEYGLDGELLASTTIRNGVKDGVKKVYYKDGSVAVETTYKEGKKDGPQRAYYQNGKRWYVLPFKNGIMDGHAVMYDQNGRIIKEAYYKNGQQVR